MKKGNYVTGSLACQNLGDCSLCDLPIVVEEPKSEEKLSNENSTIKNLLKKVSEILAA